MPPTLDRFDHIHIYVADRVASERWYADVLRLSRVPELAFWAANGGPLTIANTNGSIHLALFERPAQPCRSTIALAVGAGSFVAWRAHLDRVLPAPVTVEDHDVSWSLYFADPDGNPFEITSYEYDALAPALRTGG